MGYQLGQECGVVDAETAGAVFLAFVIPVWIPDCPGLHPADWGQGLVLVMAVGA